MNEGNRRKRTRDQGGEPRPSPKGPTRLRHGTASRPPFRPAPEARASATGGADAAWRRGGGAGRGPTCPGAGPLRGRLRKRGQGRGGRRRERSGAADGAGPGLGAWPPRGWAGPLRAVSGCQGGGRCGRSVAAKRTGTWAEPYAAGGGAWAGPLCGGGGGGDSVSASRGLRSLARGVGVEFRLHHVVVPLDFHFFKV